VTAGRGGLAGEERGSWHVHDGNGEVDHRGTGAEAESGGAARVPAPRGSSAGAILRSALLMAVVAWPSLGAEALAAESRSAAAAVLQRFTGSQGLASAWPSEMIQIEASLPKLKKTGRLRAIRTFFRMGRPDYQVLETSGDTTVKNQVIVRCILADQKTAELPALSVALTPANYKMHYEGAVWPGNRLTFVFRVVPRQKRAGLIDGVLWLDSETGMANSRVRVPGQKPFGFCEAHQSDSRI